MINRAMISQDEGFIYLILAESTNRVKIGFSEDPSKRLPQLQTGSPFALYLLAQWPAPRHMEARVHQALAKYHKGGEWFEATPDIGKLIWEVISGQLVVLPISQERQVLPSQEGELPHFPALRHPDGPCYYETRELKSGDVKVLCRWRDSKKNTRGNRIRRSLLCGRWSKSARAGLPDDPAVTEAIVFATAEAFRKARLKPANKRLAKRQS